MFDWKFKKFQFTQGNTLKGYKLYFDLKKLETFKVYITSLFKILWDYPESIYYILKNIDISKFKEGFPDFIVNNFFGNLISEKYLQNNLLYILTMMLKDEIEQINDISEISSFLENSKVSYLLEQMVKMPDVQIYLRKIIVKMVEKIENNGSFKKINLNLDLIFFDLRAYLQDEIKKLSKKKQKNSEEDIIYKYIKLKILEPSMNKENEDEIEEDKMKNLEIDENFKKYEKDITKDELENLKNESDKNNKKDMSDYYQTLIDEINKSKKPDLYSNNYINKYNNDKDIKIEHLLFIYHIDFLNIISFLQIFINDLLINIPDIPNSIKSICKIISILIRNKFKNITKFQEISFLSKFFIHKLLIPIFDNPITNALINDFVITENTQHNLFKIRICLKYLFSGQLFRNNYFLKDDDESFYTYFNRFILEESEKIFYFFEKIKDTTLPSFIEKYLNNLLPSDYLYNYFTENPGEIYTNISICFNIKNLFLLIEGMKNGENNLFSLQNEKTNRLKKIFNKFKSEEKLNELEGYDVNEVVLQNKSKSKTEVKIAKTIIKNENVENYYIINEYEIDNNYKHLFKISNKLDWFYIDIKNLEKKGKLEDKEKNIIKLKNYLINSLYNYSILIPSSFNSIDSVRSIFSQIHLNMSSSNFILNDNGIIPSNWSISSVLDYMQKIPEEYKENDYQKFFDELNQNLEDSIKELNFEALFLLRNRIQYLIKRQKYYSNCIDILTDTVYNGVVKDFIEKSFCPIEVKFSYDEDQENKFELKKSNINKRNWKDTDIIEKDEKVCFKTVASFVRYFPDLNKYQDKKDINPFQIISELSINKKIFDYFDIIKNYFIHEKNSTEEIYEQIYDEKLKNYVMKKIYKKIYPNEIEYEDSKLFEKTMHLSWVEPNMIIPGDTSLDVLDNILPDILEEFKKLNKENSPFTKLKCIKKIFEYIGVIVKFNDGGEGENREIGAEDITPYLNYVLIRACPVRLFSDIKFIKFFSKNEGKMDYDFLNVEVMCKNILESTYKNFNISESEYIKKCNEAINNNKNNSDKRFNEIIDRFQITNN